MAVARRFAVGGYRVTLMARSTDGLRDLAGALAGTDSSSGVEGPGQAASAPELEP
jgi:NADP-dependent 3-hydroxy acid dehydrogenase YdfG